MSPIQYRLIVTIVYELPRIAPAQTLDPLPLARLARIAESEIQSSFRFSQGLGVLRDQIDGGFSARHAHFGNACGDFSVITGRKSF